LTIKNSYLLIYIGARPTYIQHFKKEEENKTNTHNTGKLYQWPHWCHFDYNG